MPDCHEMALVGEGLDVIVQRRSARSLMLQALNHELNERADDKDDENQRDAAEHQMRPVDSWKKSTGAQSAEWASRHLAVRFHQRSAGKRGR
jgi:hypothetical protein